MQKVETHLLRLNLCHPKKGEPRKFDSSMSKTKCNLAKIITICLKRLNETLLRTFDDSTNITQQKLTTELASRTNLYSMSNGAKHFDYSQLLVKHFHTNILMLPNLEPHYRTATSSSFFIFFRYQSETYHCINLNSEAPLTLIPS